MTCNASFDILRIILSFISEDKLRLNRIEVLIMENLPVPAYTVPEFEQLFGIPTKGAYALIRQGKLQAFKDSAGQMRVSLEAAYRFKAERGK